MTFLFKFTPLLLGSLSLVYAIPQLSFPINAQVPPLAVVAEPFSFTFSPSTFSYDTPSITYSISNNTPSWISFDNSTRTFTGTPSSSDVGTFTFTLNANDTTGIATGDVTLLVVQDDGVTTGQDVESQLEGFGGVDGNGGIVLSNEKGFTWQFAQDTFKAGSVPITTYYAVSTGNYLVGSTLIAGHTPLPSWIKFSADNLTFTGAAPEVFSQIAPPQYFSVTLIASTHIGFASASQTFNVVIGAHDFVIHPTTALVNTTIGGNVSYTFPLDSIQLDGINVARSNISSISADLGTNGGWLNFDNTSLVLSGQATKDDKGTTVIITVTDVFDDVVRATVLVDLFNGLFATNLPSTVNATIGQNFSFVLNDTFFAAADVQLSVDFKANGGDNWLNYDSGTRTISGTPAANDAKSVEVDINAFSPSLNQKQTASFDVQTVSSSGFPLSSSTPSSSSSSNKSMIIALSVICPVGAICLFSFIVCCYRHRRKKSNKSSIHAGTPPPISRPYNTTPDPDWPLEEEKSWGEPRQLGGMGLFKRGMSGMFTLKTSEVGTTAATVGGPYDQGPEHEKALPTPMIGGPRELPKAARGSWRRSDGRDWTSNARSSDASLATVSTNEIFSVRLVQSPNPAAGGGGLAPISPAVGGVSPLLGGMGIRGAAPIVNVHPPPEENRRYGDQSQDTIGSFSEGSSGVDYEGTHWESADRMFPQSGRGSGLGRWDNNNNLTSSYSVDSFQSGHQHRGYDENERGTWYQTRDTSRDTIDDAVQYPVTRVSGPLSPMSPNIDWDSSSGKSMPARPRLVEFTKEKRVASSSSSGHGSGEVAFV